MKIYKLSFRVCRSTPWGYETLSEVEAFAKDEETLYKKENELRDAAAELGFRRNDIAVTKSILEIL